MEKLSLGIHNLLLIRDHIEGRILMYVVNVKMPSIGTPFSLGIKGLTQEKNQMQ